MDVYTRQNCEGCSAKIVCRCLNVSEAEVVHVITRFELHTIKELQAHVGAGDGCTCCHPQLEEYLEQLTCSVAIAF